MAGAILTVEARRNAYLRAAVGQVPFAQPFDTPLDLSEVYTLALPFITSCPSTNSLSPGEASTSLTMVPRGDAMNESTAILVPGLFFISTSDLNLSASFVTIAGPVWAPLKSTINGQSIVTVPAGVEGQSYIVLPSSISGVSDNNIVAGLVIIEMGLM